MNTGSSVPTLSVNRTRRVMERALLSLFALSGLAMCVGAGAGQSRQLKTGMWETHIVHSSAGKSVQGDHRACLDAAEQAHALQVAEDFVKKNCSRNDTTQEGSKQVYDSVCKAGAGSMHFHSVTDYSNDNAYHTQTMTTFDPRVGGEPGSTDTIDGKWVGACTPG